MQLLSFSGLARPPPTICKQSWQRTSTAQIVDKRKMYWRTDFFFELLYVTCIYCMARQIRVFWLVLSWSGFRHTDRFRGNGHMLRIFCFRKPANSKQAWPECHIILTNLGSSSRTGEYWPSVVFVRTSLRSVRTKTTKGEYSPVWPSRSVSKRLLFH